jgi:hypothetical protein
MVAAVVAVAALGVGAFASAQTLVPATEAAKFPTFGMIGLAKGQVAILNLVLSEPPADDHPGCQVTASFVDAQGIVFNDLGGNPVKETFTLQPQIASDLKLPAAQILEIGQLRKPIRAVVTAAANTTENFAALRSSATSAVETPSSRCTCLVANVELVNPNGQTAIVDYGKPSPPDPINPLPSAPTDGVTPPTPPIAPLFARCSGVADSGGAL